MKVLLGMGGSEDSLRALEATVERAVRADDDLVVAVVDNPEAARSADEVVARVRETLAEADLDAGIRRLTGHPGSRLVDVAESEGFDQIVLGGGESSPMGKIQVGSIAEFVLLNSRVTVKLIR
ncbi:MAG: universal stress protein [Haloferacaceae archaeon]